jgi:hypothetical protein
MSRSPRSSAPRRATPKAGHRPVVPQRARADALPKVRSPRPPTCQRERPNARGVPSRTGPLTCAQRGFAREHRSEGPRARSASEHAVAPTTHPDGGASTRVREQPAAGCDGSDGVLERQLRLSSRRVF